MESFADPYQVPRVLQAILTAPRMVGTTSPAAGLVEAVMSTPLLEK